jgi:hypothetical protein
MVDSWCINIQACAPWLLGLLIQPDQIRAWGRPAPECHAIPGALEIGSRTGAGIADFRILELDTPPGSVSADLL